MLEDVAFRIARDGVAKLVLHDGNPVHVDGRKLYEVKYDTSLLMKLLAGRDREKYGEYKVVEVNWKDWDGDVSKLSPNAVKACSHCCSGSRTPGGGGSGTKNFSNFHRLKRQRLGRDRRLVN
jgi:hypothetical protein